MLGCVRSIAWASELKAWLSNRYPSAIQSHIYLKRDGYQQFQSGLRQFIEHNNPYFLAAHVEPMLAVRPRLAAACGFDTNWIHCQSDLSPTAAITSWSSHLPHPRISSRGLMWQTLNYAFRGVSMQWIIVLISM